MDREERTKGTGKKGTDQYLHDNGAGYGTYVVGSGWSSLMAQTVYALSLGGQWRAAHEWDWIRDTIHK